MWEALIAHRRNSTIPLWCILGNFNCVRRPEERKGERSISHGGGEYRDFNKFIDDAEVDHIPMTGRRYTWYRSNGKAWSRLDSVDGYTYGEEAHNTSYKDISDHCLILLKDVNIDQGRKPFRTLDCWWEDKDFEKVLRQMS